MNKINIRDKVIGDDASCFITFEAGPTHSGFESAKEMVRLAAESGADAVKFQMTDADRLMACKEQLFAYKILVNKQTGETKNIEESLHQVLNRRNFDKAQWRALKAYADEQSIAFFATACFADEIEFLAEIGCDSVKIASADVNHTSLLKAAAKSGMVIQLDTGNASIGEIENAVDLIEANGSNKIIIHHCPSGYPAHLPSINLKMIGTLKSMFDYPIAFSDHTPGWDMDIAAVTLGANLIEKTITFDRTTPSVEHIMSIEQEDFVPFVSAIRDLEVALGNGRRALSNEQRENRKAVRRGVYLVEPGKKGQLLKDCHVEFKRPENGLSAAEWELLADMKMTDDLRAGEAIARHHLNT